MRAAKEKNLRLTDEDLRLEMGRKRGLIAATANFVSDRAAKFTTSMPQLATAIMGRCSRCTSDRADVGVARPQPLCQQAVDRSYGSRGPLAVTYERPTLR
jgi:hypothetical protein